MLTYEQVKNDPAIQTYVKKADESLCAIGYTEHNVAHVTKVAETAAYILRTMGYSEREIELARVAGYMHDIGNLVNRFEHAQTGAVMAFTLLTNMGADPEDIAAVISAIGNHDENHASPTTPVAAALILSDKTDVRRSRVRHMDDIHHDIHDRVNYSVINAVTKINDEKTEIYLALTIDTRYGSVMDYFEIFLSRMILCRKAADLLKLKFRLIINGQQLL